MKLLPHAALLAILLISPTAAQGEDAKADHKTDGAAPVETEAEKPKLMKYETRPKELIGAWKIKTITVNGKIKEIDEMMVLLPDGSVQSRGARKPDDDAMPRWGTNDKKQISFWMESKTKKALPNDDATGSWEIGKDHLLTLNLMTIKGRSVTMVLEKSEIPPDSAKPTAK